MSNHQVVPSDGHLRLGMSKGIYFIQDDRIRNCQETMGEDCWNEKLPPIRGGQFHAKPKKAGRAALSQIDSDIENGAARAPGKLSLPIGHVLKMEPANHAGY